MSFTNNIGVITFRNIKKDAFRDVVYEWEDEIKRECGGQLIYINEYSFIDAKNCTFMAKICRRLANKIAIKKIDINAPLFLAFITVFTDIYYMQNKNCIPIFLDLWPRDIKSVCKKMNNGNPFLVTSLDAYKLIKKSNKNLNVYYLPLSISDKWILDEIPEKSIDILQTGRRNPVLHEYAMRFVEKHSEFEYIYADNSIKGKPVYLSTKNGYIGNIPNRKDFMGLLKKAKICLVSSPGIDSSRIEADGLDFPTPRFYEAAINYCFMLGRYTDHEEFKAQKIPDVCDRISAYESFEETLIDILKHNRTLDKKIYDNFINKHKTSTWLKELFNIINEYIN